jgi:hypothetical protein
MRKTGPRRCGVASLASQVSAATRGSIIDEAATRVSFTVGTTMLPSFARQRGSKTLGGFIVLA